MMSFIILSVMWYERLTRCYLLLCTLTHQSSRNWRRHAKQHVSFINFELLELYWTYTSWLSKPRLQKFPRWDSWAWIMSWKWDDVPWTWTISFDEIILPWVLDHGLFWALKESFPKSMIILMWCRLLMK